jgi:hypothetical protein
VILSRYLNRPAAFVTVMALPSLSPPILVTRARLQAILFLVVALLFAQSLGLLHRIAHGGLVVPPTAQVAAGPNLLQLVASLTDANHSCAAFDAATLADNIHTAAIAVVALPNVHVLALWVAFASWTAPFTQHFLSRAPPAA